MPVSATCCNRFEVKLGKMALVVLTDFSFCDSAPRPITPIKLSTRNYLSSLIPFMKTIVSGGVEYCTAQPPITTICRPLHYLQTQRKATMHTAKAKINLQNIHCNYFAKC